VNVHPVRSGMKKRMNAEKQTNVSKKEFVRTDNVSTLITATTASAIKVSSPVRIEKVASV